MFRKKKIEAPPKELTDRIKKADEMKLNRIHVLQEYVHQLDTDRNLGRITDAEWYKQIRMVEQEVDQMESSKTFTEIMGDWEIFHD